ncbi:hypothetical protein ARMGADRAFT_1092663 [Armillaria gallica]|uniref:Uncharacterized protein n=1 Tax=Armillaria gallica TaxID=47427 RepID=A0A2H3CL91_ARMGA|nr:hypothetical protein ARMGADRAFT_1092663 [Armillaria gallica]
MTMGLVMVYNAAVAPSKGVDVIAPVLDVLKKLVVVVVDDSGGVDTQSNVDGIRGTEEGIGGDSGGPVMMTSLIAIYTTAVVFLKGVDMVAVVLEVLRRYEVTVGFTTAYAIAAAPPKGVSIVAAVPDVLQMLAIIMVGETGDHEELAAAVSNDEHEDSSSPCVTVVLLQYMPQPWYWDSRRKVAYAFEAGGSAAKVVLSWRGNGEPCSRGTAAIAMV